MYLRDAQQAQAATAAATAEDDDDDDGQLAPPLRLSQLIKQPNGSRA